ncbi:MAG TPA: TolC family protein [Candidatus Polarisedimenticolia bacterium]|nr:TolC family protein [Candidatus Polarisedimenticolia bacterium]
MRRSIALFLFLPGICLAAESPPAPSLADLQREAAERSPSVRAAAARLDAAQRAPARLDVPPDPEISLTYLNDGVSSFTLGESEFSYLGLTWTQEVPYPGKTKRAASVAEADAARAAIALRQERLAARAAVGQSYAEMFRIDQAAAILKESASILDVLARAARSRYEVGAGIQESVLKAETEILRLQAETARLEQDRAAAVAALAATLGRDAVSDPFGTVTTLPPVTVPDDADDMAAAAIASSAMVVGARAAARRGEAAVEAARYESKPDLFWSAGYQNRGDLDPMVMGMFGVRLPIHAERRQQAAALEAEDELRAARHDLAAAELRASAEARAAWARARRADRLVELYEKGVVVQARATVASAQASYGVGRIDFLDLLHDLTVLLGARIEAATQQAERMQAVAALEALTGRDLIAGDSELDPGADAPGGNADARAVGGGR